MIFEPGPILKVRSVLSDSAPPPISCRMLGIIPSEHFAKGLTKIIVKWF